MQTMHDKCRAKGVNAKCPKQSKAKYIMMNLCSLKEISCFGDHEAFDETWHGINILLNIYEQDHPNARCARVSVEMVLYSQLPRH